MVKLQRQALDIVLADPAVAGVGSSVGASGFNASVNQGRMFISLKPLSERGGLTTQRVVDRLRRALRARRGHQRVHGRGRRTSASARARAGRLPVHALEPRDRRASTPGCPRSWSACARSPASSTSSRDREQGGLQASITIDRQTASRLGVRMQDIDNALNNAFAQRQISTIYTQRNQYRVILEVDPRFQRDPSDLSRVFVPGQDGAQVPLTAVIRVDKTLAPLVVNHQGPFPAVTISYNLNADMTLDEATQAIRQAIAELRMPDSIRAEAAGDAKAFAKQANTQPLLIIAALICGLHRAGRALREPGAPADHHLDAALGRPRRADRAQARARWSSP